jgi:hypothetical protein
MLDANARRQPLLELGVEPAGRQPEVEATLGKKLHVLRAINFARDWNRAFARNEGSRLVVGARVLTDEVDDQLAEFLLFEAVGGQAELVERRVH